MFPICCGRVLLNCLLHHSTTAGNVEKFSAHDVSINIHLFLDICRSVLCLFVGHVSVRFGIQVPLSLPERQAVLRLSQPYIQPAMKAGKYIQELVFLLFKFVIRLSLIRTFCLSGFFCPAFILQYKRLAVLHILTFYMVL